MTSNLAVHQNNLGRSNIHIKSPIARSEVEARDSHYSHVILMQSELVPKPRMETTLPNEPINNLLVLQDPGDIS